MRTGRMLSWALSLATVASVARAAVDPVFMADSPAFDSRPPDVAVDGEGQDVQVLTGAAGFTYPFVVPPGRKEIAPKLSLSYSSQNGMRGGVAAGWTMSLPSIRRDMSAGTLAPAAYSANVGGASGRLVFVADASIANGATYRLRHDDAFVRFEFLGPPSNAGLSWTPPSGGWVALSPDGRRYYLGGLASASDGTSRWHVTHEVDPQGNTVRYSWSRVLDTNGQLIDFALDAIEYTANPAIGADSHARVDFLYQPSLSTCPSSRVPIGTSGDNRSGQLFYEGARKLLAVTTQVRDAGTARWRPVRQVKLNYDLSTESCSASFAPFRQLLQLQLSATSPTGQVTLLRPMTFGYGPPARPLNATTVDHRGPGLITWGDDAGLTDTLLDYDGDGVLDHLEVRLSGATCLLSVHLGLLGGAFSGGPSIALPTMPWANGSTPAWNEKCTLGGQVTFRANKIPWHHCGHGGNFNAYHFMDVDGDGKVNLVTSLQVDPDSYDPNVDPAVDNGAGASGSSNFCQPPPDTGGGTGSIPGVGSNGSECGDLPRQRNQDCAGGYAWRLYRNSGNTLVPFQRIGVLTTAATRTSVPLDPDGQANARLGVGMFSAQYGLHAVADIDGDGKVDAIAANRSAADLFWKVYRGRGNGTFAPDPVLWPVPPGVTTQPNSVGQNNVHYPKITSTYSALLDMNGDGLPDLVTQTSSGELSTFLNNGTGFSVTAQGLGVFVPVDISLSYSDNIGGGVILHSHREFDHRLFDIDHDGLPDLLDLSTSTPVYSPNAGDHFLSPRPLPAAWRSARRRIDNSYPEWLTTTDAYDADGDGLPDLVESDDTTQTRVSDNFAGAPLRLLTSVDSGRGRVVRFHYVLSTDRTAVLQTPSLGTFLPRVSWMVDQVRVSDVGGTPEVVTRYSYVDPVYGREAGQPGEPAQFFGFKTVTIDGSSATGGTSLGKRDVKTFAFDLAGDGRARLVREQTFGRDAGNALVLQRDHVLSWTVLPLFGGAVSHRAVTGETTTLCGASGGCTPTALNTLRVASTFVPYSRNGAIVLYLEESSTRGPGSAPSDQDRRERVTFQVRDGQGPYVATDYRVLEVERFREAASGSGGIFNLVGHVMNVYDPGTGLLQRTDTTLDASHVASTAFTHTVTGQVKTIVRPVAYAAGGALKTLLSYDSRELYVETTINPLGHVTTESHDLGTGVVVRKQGPQTKAGQGGGVLATTATTIDGLGRVLTEAVPVDDAAAGYATQVRRVVTYDDTSIPTSVSTFTLEDFGGSSWRSELRTYDGAGRELTLTRFRHISGQPDEQWTTNYNALGLVASVVGPDPRADTGSMILHKALSYDAMGRVTQSRAADGSGTVTRYDGMLQTDEDLTAPTGAKKTVLTTLNPFGEIIRVDEVDPGHATATTRFAYAPQGGVRQVVDADGVTTSYTRDFLSQITAINRAGRVWQYGFDLNGNPTFARSPRPTGAAAADYTVQYTYDALNRLTRRRQGSRGMSAARLAELGIGDTTFQYDQTDNGIGQLGTATTPTTTTAYAYDARGEVTDVQRAFHVYVPGLSMAEATQRVSYAYTASGERREVAYDDGTRWRIRRDARGLSNAVEWLDPSTQSYRAVARFTRSVQGQVRGRDTDFLQRRSYTYDVMGRVTNDAVVGGSGDTLRAWRSYLYDARGDVTNVMGDSNGQTAGALFSYDALHRIRTAIGPRGYVASFDYSSAGNVSRASVQWNGGAFNRTVTYQYGAVDPQAVDALVATAGSTPFAQFTYDASGAVTRRTVSGATTDFTWDSEDRPREASGPGGREVYLYDENGQRTLIVSAAGVRFYFAGSETHYAPAGGQALRYLHIEEGVPLARIENRTNLELMYSDTLKNLILALGPTGAVKAAPLYGAFGERLIETGAATHRRQFNDKENDALTGLSYYGFRYYDPLALRWTSSDPLARIAPEIALRFPQLLNLYSFSLNNPMTYVDPDGRAPKTETQESAGSKGCGQGMEDSDKCKKKDEKKTDTNGKKRSPEEERRSMQKAAAKLYRDRAACRTVSRGDDKRAVEGAARDLSREFGRYVSTYETEQLLRENEHEELVTPGQAQTNPSTMSAVPPGWRSGPGPAKAEDMEAITHAGPLGLFFGGWAATHGGSMEDVIESIKLGEGVDEATQEMVTGKQGFEYPEVRLDWAPLR